MAGAETIEGYTLAGAVVRRPYSTEGRTVPKGTVLSVEALNKLSHAIRRLWLRDGDITPIYVPQHYATGGQTHHLIHRGAGRYDVVLGTMINAEPLTREQAEALIIQPTS
jgi:hypothetical protein